MSSRFLFVMLLFISAPVFSIAQPKTKPKAPAMQISEYWFVLLKKGPNRLQDSATAAQIQTGHLANMTRLYKEGKLKVAGPFGE
jgi:uncharacterized protein